MPQFLLFALEAPLAALGDVAVGERRYGAARPAKSAVLGLVAAALGIERTDEAAHHVLHDGFGYAVRIDREGQPLEDFHTAQTPPSRRGRTWPTRKAELEEEGLETILSYRDYRTDVGYTAALWSRGDSRWSLDELAAALQRPRFTLYLGRKACPLGRAPGPVVVPTATLTEAFADYDDQAGDRRPGARLHADREAAAWLGPGWQQQRLVERRDALASRRRWQFRPRAELIAVAVDQQGANR